MVNETEPRVRRNKRIVVYQAILIVLMSAAGACGLLPEIGERYYIAIIIFGWLAVTGAFSLVFPRINPLVFSLSVFLAVLVAMLSVSLFYLGGTPGNKMITGFGFMRNLPAYVDMEPWVQFGVLAGLGIFVIACHIVLSNLHSLQNDYRNMLTGQVDETELKSVIRQNISRITDTVVKGSLVVAVMGGIIKCIQIGFVALEADLEWAILLLGIPAVLAIAVQIYVLTVKRNKNEE